jgi:hypothetical protein
MSFSAASTTAPYPQAGGASQRNAAIWSTSDDEILLRARASGLNWQPIASRNFPNKTANACRKRHERLIERRHVDDWDNQKLELLAREYLACRKEMWEILAARLGERWNVVEAKVSSGLAHVCRTRQLTLFPVHGEGHQNPTDHSPHCATQSIGRPTSSLLRRSRYFRPQQRLRHCAVFGLRT